MPRLKWTTDDISKLKRLAGLMSAKDTAAELGRSQATTVVEASKLGLSLRFSRRSAASKNEDERASSNS